MGQAFPGSHRRERRPDHHGDHMAPAANVKRNLPLRKTLWERFHEKVSPEPNSGCWLWTGAVKELGYGVIGLGRRQDGTAKAHRVAYELYKGEIPEGGNVLHSCDVPSCVNPAHLRVGTLSENMRDCVKRGRNFTPDNRGENASWAKLTASAVAHIRQRVMTGPSYAALYGVSKSAIYEIWRGHNWARG